jgi:hypothetical protein
MLGSVVAPAASHFFFRGLALGAVLPSCRYWGVKKRERGGRERGRGKEREREREGEREKKRERGGERMAETQTTLTCLTLRMCLFTSKLPVSKIIM